VAASKTAIKAARPSLKYIEPNETTKMLIKAKHRAYRQWKKSKMDGDQKYYYNCKALLSNALRNQRIDRFNKLMSSLSQRKMHSTSVWAVVRKYHNKRTKQVYSSDIKYRNRNASTDQEKADLFAAYFENEVFASRTDRLPFHRQVTEKVEQIKNQINKTSMRKKPPLITSKEVKSILKQLPNSSPGPDNIHNRCLKNYTTLLVHNLVNLFNAIITAGHIPMIWKNANIILLLKPKKDKNQPSSYRPISLLSCIGKLLEKIIKQRLTNELENRNILPEHQAGFRRGKSTIYNITRLERHAHEQLAKKRHSAVIFFDIKAAFDSVWFEGLIYKVHDLRLSEYLIRFVVAFLESRTASIELENILSRPFSLRSGTPQGSPLSPLLYIIYTADSMSGISNNTEHGLFADDTALWTSSNTVVNVCHRLQQSVDEFQRWCVAWKLAIQPIKTELIHFSPHPRKKYKNQIAITVENTKIKPQESARYLGIIFDRKLNWRAHTNHIESKIASRIGLLRFLYLSATDPNDKIMINLFKALIRSVLTYGYPALLTASDKVWDRLQITQNKAIRAALGVPPYTSVEYIHNLSKLPRIKQYSKTLLERAIFRSKQVNDKLSEDLLTDILTH
jgi:hypothetical protein